MPKLPFRIWPLSAALAFTATLAAAQTPPAPPPGAAPPPALAEPSTAAPQMLSVKTQSALKLAGLVTFVANGCPAIKPNYVRFKEALSGLGVAEADLAKGDMRNGYLRYTARYASDAKESCRRADAQFGPNGATIAGIFEPR